MHAMRVRRTGDANTVRPPGRRPDPDRQRFLRMFAGSSWSARTEARLWRAWVLLRDFGGTEALEDAVKRSRRPNGGLNVARMEWLGEAAVVKWVIDHPEEEDPDGTS